MKSTLFHAWQFAIILLLAIVLLSVGIPSVRASLSAWLGLSSAPANQMPSTSVTLVAIPTLTPTAASQSAPTPTLAAPTTTAAQPSQTPEPAATAAVVTDPALAQAASQAGWSILTPRQLPEGYHFQSAYYDTNHQMVILTYLVTRPLPGATDPSLTASTTITLVQAQKNDFIPMQIAPDSHVEDIQVNGQPGAYVVGAWDSSFVKDDKDPNGGKMVSTWRNDLAVQNVYWQVGQVYLVAITDDTAVSKSALIDMASSVGGN